MEKPRQGPPHTEIIVQDEVKSPLRRFTEDFITIVCWGIYLYLLLPLFTLFLWILGVQTIYDQIIGERGYEELARLLENGGITTLVILLIVSGWTYYNYRWFKRRGERRGGRVMISSDVEIARMLDVDMEAMDEIRASCRMLVKVDNGNYRVELRPEPPPS
ncbi:MAG TPA: poly-beta-1,6-N-acetyl-D-glucosamine biosynthesis protein PgaD [Syntrophales bacterium]|nr:poly-beta-1,6-N-acetyl-D-glucosamine biosynthesis protein PgaD [Syntrophales bacterium]